VAVTNSLTESVNILAQSIGGGGRSAVAVTNAAAISTGTDHLDLGAAMHGIAAQSVGDGGGNQIVVVDGTVSTQTGGGALSVGLGLSGSASGSGNTASVTSSDAASTLGAGSVGLLAQSVGGDAGMRRRRSPVPVRAATRARCPCGSPAASVRQCQRDQQRRGRHGRERPHHPRGSSATAT
jgi:hypothetical protein